MIALVDTRADARIGLASNLLDPVTPTLADLLDLGPGKSAELGSDAAAIAARRWQSAIARALELAQVPYAIVDEAASEAELAHYRAVIAPTQDRIDRGLWQRLRANIRPMQSVADSVAAHRALYEALRGSALPAVGAEEARPRPRRRSGTRAAEAVPALA